MAQTYAANWRATHFLVTTDPTAMQNSLGNFDRISIINLASRSDRRAEMAEQLGRIGLSITGNEKVRLVQAVRPEDAGDFPSIGARGCFMSHLSVLRDAAAARSDRILILEDDLNFSRDFATRAPTVWAHLEALDWAIFYGGYEMDRLPESVDACVAISPTIVVRTTHFVGFKGAVIPALAKYLEAMLERSIGHPDGGPMHVDGAYSFFRRANPCYATLVAVPALGYQRASRTDIHALRWFDRMPGVRYITSAVRRARNG